MSNLIEKCNTVEINENPYFSKEYITLDDSWIYERCKKILNFRTDKIHKVLEVQYYETEIPVCPQFGFFRSLKRTMLKVENQDEILIGDKIIEVRENYYE